MLRKIGQKRTRVMRGYLRKGKALSALRQQTQAFAEPLAANTVSPILRRHLSPVCAYVHFHAKRHNQIEHSAKKEKMIAVATRVIESVAQGRLPLVPLELTPSLLRQL